MKRRRLSEYGPGLRTLAAVAALSAAPALAADAAPAGSAAEADWTPRDLLAPSQRAQLPEWCSGMYVAPPLPPGAGAVPNDQAPLDAEADSATYELGTRAVLRGDVQLERGTQRLTTDRAIWFEADNRVALTGAVKVREPGLLMQGEAASVELADNSARLSDATFVLHDAALRGQADALARTPAGLLQADQAQFTRCEPGDDSWMVRASEISVDRDKGVATARNARLRVGGVPVFYSPWIRFPLGDERQSGFLFPGLGYSNEKGLDLTLPYYLNLAPNYDATISPRLLSSRGYLLEGEFRHLSAAGYNQFGAAYLPQDDDYNGKFTRADFTDLGLPGQFEPADRWLAHWQHDGRWLGQHNVRTRVDVTEISDSDYFRDLGTDLQVTSRADLERVGEVTYDRPGLNVRLWAQSFKPLDDRVESYERLPELAVSYRRPLGPLDAELRTSIGNFDRDTSRLTGFAAIVGQRIHVEPRISLPFDWPYASVRATGALRHTDYYLDNAPLGTDRSPRRDIGMASLDAALFLERDVSLLGATWRQTLEPRAFYLYQQYDGQSQIPSFDTSEYTFSYEQLFRDNRFSGTDRIGDANHVALGLQTRFLNSGGEERLRASIGQIYRFRNQQVTLSGPPLKDDRASTSSVVGELTARYGQLSLVTRMSVDPRDQDTEEAAVGLAWRSLGGHVLNVGYRQYEPDIEQTDFSVYLPVGSRWAVYGRWNYDVQDTAHIEWFAGIQFDNCCWRVRLMNRHFVKTPSNSDIENTEQGIFLQIVFKGLTGIGDEVEQILSTTIPGFQDDQYRF